MIPPNFDYQAPETLADAVALLSGNPGAKILSGGQSLIPMMRFRLAEPVLIVDINRVPGLEYIREQGGWLKIGGLTRESAVDGSDLVASRYPLLADTARLIADPLVRNRATVGGNLAHADPANDHPATMLAYRARVVATGPAGEREIPIDEFFLGPFESSLIENEILTEVRIPSTNGRSGGAYQKLERKVGDYATAAVATQVTLDGAGNVASAGIGLTNVGLTPIRASAAEEYLTGRAPTEANISQAASLAAEAAEPEPDYRGSVAYKRSLVRTLTYRALMKAVARANGGQA
ncbi:MAG: xanthine dehydrogenase family protein subunit M [Anaerolineales bacterium]|nr:MAG: xanthine dehydrogenase family protein subunit M [Anaerolineales bacterium]